MCCEQELHIQVHSSFALLLGALSTLPRRQLAGCTAHYVGQIYEVQQFGTDHNYTNIVVIQGCEVRSSCSGQLWTECGRRGESHVGAHINSARSSADGTYWSACDIFWSMWTDIIQVVEEQEGGFQP